MYRYLMLHRCKSVSRYTAPDFLYVRSWLPCIFFSGGITMGNIGRQLALVSKLQNHMLYSFHLIYYFE